MTHYNATLVNGSFNRKLIGRKKKKIKKFIIRHFVVSISMVIMAYKCIQNMESTVTRRLNSIPLSPPKHTYMSQKRSIKYFLRYDIL